MYTENQLSTLFALIGSLKESADANPAVEALAAEADRLKAISQVLVLGTHEHKHGESQYLFLVSKEMDFGVAAFEGYLQEDYEPELDEFLQVTTLNDVVHISE